MFLIQFLCIYSINTKYNEKNNHECLLDWYQKSFWLNLWWLIQSLTSKIGTSMVHFKFSEIRIWDSEKLTHIIPRTCYWEEYGKHGRIISLSYNLEGTLTMRICLKPFGATVKIPSLNQGLLFFNWPINQSYPRMMHAPHWKNFSSLRCSMNFKFNLHKLFCFFHYYQRVWWNTMLDSKIPLQTLESRHWWLCFTCFWFLTRWKISLLVQILFWFSLVFLNVFIENWKNSCKIIKFYKNRLSLNKNFHLIIALGLIFWNLFF